MCRVRARSNGCLGVKGLGFRARRGHKGPMFFFCCSALEGSESPANTTVSLLPAITLYPKFHVDFFQGIRKLMVFVGFLHCFTISSRAKLVPPRLASASAQPCV